MALKLKYQSQQFSKDRSSITQKVTYYGTESEVDTMISGLTIGNYDSTYNLYLNSFNKSQMDGQFYQLELQYGKSFGNATSDRDTTIYGQKSCTLSTRNITLSLQKLSTYRANWNYYFYVKGATYSQSYWQNATNTKISSENKNKYRWQKQPINQQGWVQVKKPTKLGTDGFDYSTFVVTQRSKYGSASSAGNALSTTINKMKAPSNTFGLSSSSSMWKLDSASITYNGEDWQLNSEYTYSGNSAGWDTDLYGNSVSINWKKVEG